MAFPLFAPRRTATAGASRSRAYESSFQSTGATSQPKLARGREVAALLLWTAALFLFLALASYAGDPKRGAVARRRAAGDRRPRLGRAGGRGVRTRDRHGHRGHRVGDPSGAGAPGGAVRPEQEEPDHAGAPRHRFPRGRDRCVARSSGVAGKALVRDASVERRHRRAVRRGRPLAVLDDRKLPRRVRMPRVAVDRAGVVLVHRDDERDRAARRERGARHRGWSAASERGVARGARDRTREARSGSDRAAPAHRVTEDRRASSPHAARRVAQRRRGPRGSVHRRQSRASPSDARARSASRS